MLLIRRGKNVVFAFTEENISKMVRGRTLVVKGSEFHLTPDDLKHFNDLEFMFLYGESHDAIRAQLKEHGYTWNDDVFRSGSGNGGG